METPFQLRWKRGFFSNETSLYIDSQKVGSITHEYFSPSMTGEIFNKRYQFISSGPFSDTFIIDLDENREIGKINKNVLVNVVCFFDSFKI